MTYLEGLNKVIEAMGEAKLDQNAQRTMYLGLIAMQLATMNDELARMIKHAGFVELKQEPRREGHWIDNHNGTISCSSCHTWFHKDDRYSYMHYCPNCKVKIAESEEP